MKIFKFNEFIAILEQYTESSDKGILIGTMFSNIVNKQVPIYENPESLNSFIKGCQGLLTEDGTLYIAADKIFHINLIKFLQDKGKLKTNFKFKEASSEETKNQDIRLKIDQENAQIVFGAENIKELGKLVLLTRNENTDMMCLSPSYRADIQLNNTEFLDSIISIIMNSGSKFKNIQFSPNQITSEEEKKRHVSLFRDFR